MLYLSDAQTATLERMASEGIQVIGIIPTDDEVSDDRIILGIMPRKWYEVGTWMLYQNGSTGNGHYFTSHQAAYDDADKRRRRGY